MHLSGASILCIKKREISLNIIHSRIARAGVIRKADLIAYAWETVYNCHCQRYSDQFGLTVVPEQIAIWFIALFQDMSNQMCPYPCPRGFFCREKREKRREKWQEKTSSRQCESQYHAMIGVNYTATNNNTPVS